MDNQKDIVKNPLLKLDKYDGTKIPAESVVKDFFRTRYLIRGLRYAVAYGLDVSVFDLLVKVSSDGQSGEVTKKRITDFVNEFAENCFQTTKDRYIFVDGYGDVENPYENIKDRDYYPSTQEPTNIELCLNNYVKGFIGAYIITWLTGGVIYCLEEELDEASLDYSFLKIGKTHITYNMNNTNVIKCREKLRFEEIVNACASEPIRSAEQKSIFGCYTDGPFNDLFEQYLALMNVSTELPPNFLIEEYIIVGIENYGFNNMLSLYFDRTSKQPKLNNNYYDAINGLRNAINILVNLYNTKEDD